MKQLLIFAVIVMTASAQTHTVDARCVLVAGVGCGNLFLNKTKRSDFLPDAATEKRFASEGLTFTFDANDTLDGIVAVGNEGYKTDKGVSPGDKEERVLQAYGKPEKSGKMVLNKGENEPIGTVGDRTLMYPGVLFVISKDRVWAIEIVPASNSKS
jgi:hypothetical protein